MLNKINKKLLSLHARLALPAVLGASVLGLIICAQLTPIRAQVHSQTASVKKSIPHPAATSHKAAQPAAVPAPPAPAAPKTGAAAAAPVKATTTAASSKPQPVVTPSPSSSVSGLAPVAPATSPSSASTPTTTSYTSTNWSGYLATNGSFSGISGAWTATNPTGIGATTSADSTWIGIGGVTTSDLIQVGTQNIIAPSGQVSASAFYELLPNVSQPVPGLTVSPGDSMTASLSQVSAGQWAVSITDRTNGDTYSSTLAYSSSLSSAEWIEEDPSFSSRRQIPFDNFQSAAFSNGSTTATGTRATIAASNAQPITMVNRSGQNVAVPSALGSDGASFTVTP